MIERFVRRTRRHIALVGANLAKMTGYIGLGHAELDERAREHDLSKFDEREREGYIWLTWIYDCRPADVAPEIARAVERALDVHRRRNAHHPEAHLVPDAMSVLDLVEMVCDWTAIAQENGGASARPWALANLTRWAFSRPARDFIFVTIDELDRRNALGAEPALWR